MYYYKLLLNKTFKNRNNVLLLLLLFLGIVGLYILNLNTGDFYSYLGQVKDHHNTTIELEEYYENILNDDVKYSEDDIESFKGGLQDALEQKEWNEKILELADQKEWSKALSYSIEIINRHLHVNEKAGGDLFPEDHVFALKQEKVLYEQLAALDHEPDTEGYERFGFNYVYRIMDSIFPVFFALILSVFLSEIFVNTYKQGFNIDLLLPSGYIRTTLRKILYCTLFAVCVYIITLFISFVLASIITGTGSFRYPILLYSLDTVATVPVWIIIAKTLTLHALSILNIVLLVSIISYFAKNKLITLLITVVFIIGSSMVLKSLDVLNSMIHLNPFTYLSGADVVTNLMAYQSDNPSITFENGVFFLSVFAVILIAAILLLVRQREKKQMLARK
ncbi:hypothetical protein MUB24_17215 [Lederbergia sp. NSJ-179]|uniref:hypothetical protein n=1 Tax=Lederbergia sp. NSJ-179 TaxID=2931402 RepID=UPI001FD4AAFC|nr:hypothetical protein [Lederbergia sp. NSJ-179]MCJ7842605.1 hypothetical protein [Lederbergia sp. NSJ-179]